MRLTKKQSNLILKAFLYLIGYDDLIQNKIMSRRAKDLEDIAQLERRKNRKG